MFSYQLCCYITHSSYLEIQYLSSAFPVAMKAEPRLLLIKHLWPEFHLQHCPFTLLKNSEVSKSAPQTWHLWADVPNSLSARDFMVPAIFGVSNSCVWTLSCLPPYSLSFLTDFLPSALLAFHTQDCLWQKIISSWSFLCPRHTVCTSEQRMGVGF